MENHRKVNIKNWYKKHIEASDFGERLADSVATGMGSWRFIIIQTIIVAVWMVLNVVAFVQHWDPYPYILLNLLRQQTVVFGIKHQYFGIFKRLDTVN